MGRHRSATLPRFETALPTGAWDGRRVLALRLFLGLTQAEFSQRLGTRQQTVSEWEVGRHRPRGMSAALLSNVARETGFEPIAG